MSTPEEPQAVEESGEQRQMSERTAKVVLLVVACGGMWGIVAVLPETAYFVAGILACRGWQKVSGWIGGRRGEEDQDADEVTAAQLIEALHGVAGPNVFLADLASVLALPVADARALLEQHRIRVRRAVRNGKDTGVGVHQDDLPPLPQPLLEDPEEGVDLQQQSSTNTPTAEMLGLAGVVVKDGSETGRRHHVPRRGRRTSS